MSSSLLSILPAALEVIRVLRHSKMSSLRLAGLDAQCIARCAACCLDACTAITRACCATYRGRDARPPSG